MPSSPLVERMHEYFHGLDANKLVECSVALRRHPVDSQLAVLVYETAKEGDAAAETILKKGALELVDVADTCVRKLGFDNGEAFLSGVWGSVFTNNEFFHRYYAEEFVRRYPAGKVVFPDGDAADGATQLAIDYLRGGFEGPVYPVNLRAQSILGQTCFPTLRDIPGPVELLVICVPAGHVADVLEQGVEKDAKGAIIISGGFREIGQDAAEERLLEIARRGGMRLIGPNCQGVNYTANRLCATWPFVATCGAVGVVSQSGTIGAEIELLAEADGLGVSCFAALGNKLDISEIDFIDFFREDPNTQVIALNVEGLRDGFAEVVARAAREKPVVVLKPGWTQKGMAAMLSHTRSIAGNDRLFSAFCPQARHPAGR